MVDGLGTTRYTYDAANQILSEGGLWQDDTVSYTYANRQRIGLSLAQPGSDPWTQSYGYDAAKRLTSVASSAGVFSYAYDPVRNLQVSNLTLPSGAYIKDAYDSVDRLLSTKLVNSSGTALDSQSYAYNQAAQRTAETNLPGDYRDYNYDTIGQLKRALGQEPGGVTNRFQEQLGYAYDAAGNLNWRTNNALIEAFNVNSLNELTTETNRGTLTVAGTTTSHATSVTVNGVTATNYVDSTFAKDGFTLLNGTNTFTAIAQDSYGRKDTNVSICYLPATNSYVYDSNGNLLGDGNRSFAYDDENQLISVWVTNVWRSDFLYDGKMRRRVRVESTWSGSIWFTNTVVRYAYDGNLVIQERWLNPQLLPQDAFSYTRGPDLSGSLQGSGGIGGLLARTDNGQLIAGLPSAHAFYHADGNGNISALINSVQAIVAKYLYDPFGNILSRSGSLADVNLYRFSSKEFHPASSLTCYLYRLYDPDLQRWINRDPIEEGGGFNPYGFVRNAPIGNYDAFGLVCYTHSSGPGTFHSNLWGHNLGNGPASSLTFTMRCPKCFPNLLDYQLGYVGVTPPASGTAHGHSFPDDWTTVSLTPAGSDANYVLYTIVINVTSTTSLGNDWGLSNSISGVFIAGTCCEEQGPPYRIPGLSPVVL